MVLSVLFLPLFQLAVQGNFAGQVSCPCTQDNSLIPLDSKLSKTDYGTSCKPWDDVKDYCQPSHPEYEENKLWCPHPWCYVDPNNCKPQIGHNIFSAQQTAVFEKQGIDLWYSYETCGAPDHYTGAWDYEFEYAEKCACTGSNAGDKKLEGTDIGTLCAPWDDNKDYCDPNEPTFRSGNELWCPEAWCFVKPGCVAELDGRNYTSSASVFDQDSGLFQSYETCKSHNYLNGWNYDIEICPERSPVDVYLLVDSSGSVKNDWSYIQQATSKIAKLFDSNYGDRVGIVLFGGTLNDPNDKDVNAIVPLSSNINAVAAKAAKMNMLKTVKKSHHTWTMTGIEYTLDLIDANPPAKGHKPLLVIITDGKPNPADQEHPCDPDVIADRGMNPREELDARGVKTLIFEVRLEFDDLDCLVEDPEKDILFVADPQKFFEGVTEDLFCVTENTPAPTPPPTCSSVVCGQGTKYDDTLNHCVPRIKELCGEGTEHDVGTDMCVAKPTSPNDSCTCGVSKRAVKKGQKVGNSASVDDACMCQGYCSIVEGATEWMFSQSGKCQCYSGKKLRFNRGSNVVGSIA